MKAGDLVMVIKPTLCCGDPAEIGITFIAENCGEDQFDVEVCTGCGEHIPIRKGTHLGFEESGLCFQVERLKRIPPIEELDQLEKEQQLSTT